MQPSTYTPSESFNDSERNNAGGRSTVRTAMLDAELTAIAKSINGLITNIKLLQRDDGKVLDGIIEPYNFSAATKAYVLGTKWNARGLWSSASIYALNDMVDQGGSSYICAVAHTAGTFATDYAAGRWQIFTSAGNATALIFSPTTQITSSNAQSAIVEVDTNARAASSPLQSALFGGF
jgi:hypothetical protein